MSAYICRRESLSPAQSFHAPYTPLTGINTPIQPQSNQVKKVTLPKHYGMYQNLTKLFHRRFLSPYFFCLYISLYQEIYLIKILTTKFYILNPLQKFQERFGHTLSNPCARHCLG